MGTRSNGSDGKASRTHDGAQILPFKMRATARLRKRTPVMDPLRRLETAEDRHRMHQNLAAALVIALLLATGMWLIEHLEASARITVCLEAGHPNCLR
jgi:hypothetical protein